MKRPAVARMWHTCSDLKEGRPLWPKPLWSQSKTHRVKQAHELVNQMSRVPQSAPCFKNRL